MPDDKVIITVAQTIAIYNSTQKQRPLRQSGTIRRKGQPFIHFLSAIGPPQAEWFSFASKAFGTNESRIEGLCGLCLPR